MRETMSYCIYAPKASGSQTPHNPDAAVRFPATGSKDRQFQTGVPQHGDRSEELKACYTVSMPRKQAALKRRTTLTLPSDSLLQAQKIANSRQVYLSTVISEVVSTGLQRSEEHTSELQSL